MCGSRPRTNAVNRMYRFQPMAQMPPSSLLKALKNDFRTDTERGKLLRSSGLTAGMKIGATLIALLASLLYARALGPNGFGAYAYVAAWVTILTIPAGLGLPQYLIREVARCPQSIFWLLRWTDDRLFVAGLITALLMTGAAFIPGGRDTRWLFIVAAPIPLLSNLSASRSALLQAQGRIASSQWPQALIAPLVMLCSLALLWLWQRELRPIELIGAMTGCALIPLIISSIQLKNSSHLEGLEPSSNVSIRNTMPFMLLAGLYILNNRVDLIMVGSISGAHDTGVYAIASRVAMLTPFVAEAANITLAPRVSQLYHTGQTILLRRMLRAATWRYTLITAALAVLLIVAAHPLIGYLYGTEYHASATPLQILVIGYFIRVALGSAGTVLTMTGREKAVAYNMLFAVVINIVMNGLLISRYGSIGASIATAFSLVLSQVLLWRQAHRQLNRATIHISLKPNNP